MNKKFITNLAMKDILTTISFGICISSIIIFIGAILLIFEEKLNMKRKHKRLAYKILILISLLMTIILVMTMVYCLLFGTESNEFGGINLIPRIANMIKEVICSFVILIEGFILIFGEKLKIRKKTRILIYAILIFMPLIINSIYSLSVGAMSVEFFGWRIDVNIIIALIIILVGLLVSILNIKRKTKILIIIPLILILIPLIIAIISSLL